MGPPSGEQLVEQLVHLGGRELLHQQVVQARPDRGARDVHLGEEKRGGRTTYTFARDQLFDKVSCTTTEKSKNENVQGDR